MDLVLADSVTQPIGLTVDDEDDRGQSINQSNSSQSLTTPPVDAKYRGGGDQADISCQSNELSDSIDCKTCPSENSPPSSPEELLLLAKLDQANRMLEADSKALHSLTDGAGFPRRDAHPSSSSLSVKTQAEVVRSRGDGHSRQSSLSSIKSSTSVMSSSSGLQYDGLDASNSSTQGPQSEECLWALWSGIISDWENINKKKSSYVTDLVHRGIPAPLRGIVWQLLCGARDCTEKERYAELLKLTSPFEKTISRDITRTYPRHELFKVKDGLGQESLFNVMKAYSLYDREVGYCQGSAFIVGMLLMQMPEEEAYAVLIKIMYSYNMRELFKPSMAELGLRMYQLDVMIKDELPDLALHFQSQGVTTSMYASSWFLTLFTTVVCLPLSFRIFEIFLSEGMEFILRVGVAMLKLNCETLLSLDMEELIQFLQRDIALKTDSDHDLLLSTACSIKYNARKMKKLQKEYATAKSKEQEEQVELRRLRSENKLLRQRVDNLEKETEMLADRLIQDQVKCAQQEEQILLLHRKIARHNIETDLNKAATATASAANGQHLAVNSKSPAADLTTTAAEDRLSAVLSTSSAVISANGKALPVSNSSSVVTPANNKALPASSSASSLHSAIDGLSLFKSLRPHFLRSSSSQHDVTETVKDRDNRIEQLQNELDVVHAALKNQQIKVNLLEQAVSGRSSDVSADMVKLQEELIACKLREAEAQMDIKELQRKLFILDKQWQKYQDMVRCDSPAAVATESKAAVSREQQLSEGLMSAQLREAQLLSELTDLKQRLLQLEQQTRSSGIVCKTLEDENASLKKSLQLAEAKGSKLSKPIATVARLMPNESCTSDDSVLVNSLSPSDECLINPQINNSLLPSGDSSANQLSEEKKLNNMEASDVSQNAENTNNVV